MSTKNTLNEILSKYDVITPDVLPYPCTVFVDGVEIYNVLSVNLKLKEALVTVLDPNGDIIVDRRTMELQTKVIKAKDNILITEKN